MSIERFNDNIRNAFGSLEQRINGAAGGALHALRRSALEAFTTQGVPTIRHEEWKYTNVLPLLASDLQQSPDSDLAAHDLAALGHMPDVDAWRLVVVNGMVRTDVSTLPEGDAAVTVQMITDDLLASHPRVAAAFGHITPASAHPFVAVNAALTQQGILVHVHGRLARPLHILCVGDARASDILHTPRVLILADTHAEATIIESHHTVGTFQALDVTVVEVLAEAGSHVRYFKLLHDANNASHIGSTAAVVARDARAVCATVVTGGRFVRNDLHVRLVEPGASGYLYGVSVLDGTSFADNHTVVDHVAPHCHSEELYKGVYDDKSVGVFNGKIFVREDAQKTTAYQSNHALLLSESAQINAKPQLEIWADDVKCSHGATTGQLNEDALFYLRARGLPEGDARKLLTHAFAAEVMDHLDDDAIRTHMVALIDEALA
ncbi:MAG: Fe-S cluster assembly protein SufD [Candidatus Kapabacteria bacterium]|nr:Fe-S cluster assembly protein SufD [Candidatus Kapabacteria bacterium]